MADTPHDSLFRFTFRKPENAAALIRANLAERVAARIDWRSLGLENGSFVDEDAKWLHCDLIFSARISRRPAFIYVLLEHQSSPDAPMPLRMLSTRTTARRSGSRDHSDGRPRKRIETASIGDLDRMVARILTATSVQEVFGDKAARPAKPRGKKS